MMKSLLNRKVRLAFGFATLTLLLMGALSYRWMLISDDSGRWVMHTNVVLTEIKDLMLSMKSVEYSSRQFVLTGKESELESYQADLIKVQQDEGAIRALTADNPIQQSRLTTLAALGGENIRNAETIIGLRRVQGHAAAVGAILTGQYQTGIDQFQTLAGTMQDEETLLRAQRLARTERYANQTKVALIVGTFLGIFISGWAAWSALRDAAKREVAVEELRQSEEKYRLLLDGIHDYAIFLLDPDGNVASWNAGAERVKGYTAQQILGQHFARFFPSVDVNQGKPGEILRMAAANGKFTELGIRVRKDGSEFLAGVTDSALRDSEGNLRGFSVVSHDLTARQESEARFRGLMEAAPDGMVVVNQAGDIVLLNARAESQFGYRRDELLGQKVTDIIPTGFAERLIADGTRTAAEALAQQIGTGIELIGHRNDGTNFPIEIMLSPLESTDGILVTAAIRDITVRKNAERHLAQMEGRYRGLMEAAPDGMVVVNQGGDIVLLNARAEKQFGYRRDELIGQRVTNIIPVGFAERLIADALRTTAEALAQQIGMGIELNGRRSDGTAFPIEIMLSPLESPEGTFVTAAIRDISERKQLARQLHQSQKMEAVGQLTGGIAHDFNNLLGVITGNLDLLERLIPDNAQALKRVQTAQKAASRGADITRRLLVFSSNEELKPSTVLLGDSIQNMIELAGHGLGPDIKITTRIDESVPPIFIDPAGLESALLNLVVNARDAMPKGGSILIASHAQELEASHPAVLAGDLKPGPYVCIAVTDSGHGMSRLTMERIFEPFFTTKPRDKGTGLGLAMVYGFVKQSGGTVRVYSELGYGTTVSFYLPLTGSILRPISDDAPRPLNTENGCIVLVVDDEEDLLEIAVAYLAEMGFTSFRASDGASALELLMHQNEVELLVTDIVMPGGMNGVELVEKARAFRPDLKIIYSSGFPAEALAERSMSLVDGPLLHKPYQRSEFTAIIHHVMDSKYAAPAR